MNIKTIEIGSEDHIILTKNGIAVGVIEIRRIEREDLYLAEKYDAFQFVGFGIEERHPTGSRFYGGFACAGSFYGSKATVEAIEEVLIKS